MRWQKKVDVVIFRAPRPFQTCHSPHVLPRPSKGGPHRRCESPHAYSAVLSNCSHHRGETTSNSHLRQFTEHFEFKDWALFKLSLGSWRPKLGRSVYRFTRENVTPCKSINYRHIACSNIPVLCQGCSYIIGAVRSCPCKSIFFFRLSRFVFGYFWTTTGIIVTWILFLRVELKEFAEIIS